MKKGMSLPIEVVIVLVIAIVVLIAVILFFTTTMNKGQGSMKEQQDWQKACGALRMMKCDVTQITSIFEGRMVSDDPGDTSSLCYMVAGTNDHKICCQVCCGDDPGCGTE